MANRTQHLIMTRGDSRTLTGTITPGDGGTLSTPITSLEFSAGDISKTVGDGVTVSAESSSSITFSVEIDPADTESLSTTQNTTLTYVLILTEGDGTVSRPVGGKLIVEASPA